MKRAFEISAGPAVWEETPQRDGGTAQVCLATMHAIEQALVEREVARLPAERQGLACKLIRRIAEIETESGPDVAEAVVDGMIDILCGRTRVLS